MFKKVAVLALAAALLVSVGQKAEANPVVAPVFAYGAGTAAGPAAGVFFGAMFGGALLVPIIVSGFDPWHKVFSSVEYSYPHGKAGL